MPSWEAVKLAVAKGTGVSGLSRYALMTELAAGTLEILKSSGLARVRRHFSLVHARDIPLSPPAERFRAILVGEMRKLATAGSKRVPRRKPSGLVPRPGRAVPALKRPR